MVSAHVPTTLDQGVFFRPDTAIEEIESLNKLLTLNAGEMVTPNLKIFLKSLATSKKALGLPKNVMLETDSKRNGSCTRYSCCLPSSITLTTSVPL